MSLLRCVIAGVGGALVAIVIWAIATLLWPLATFWWVVRHAAVTGSGGLGAVSVGFSPVSLTVAASLGFALGFHLLRRRQKQKARAA
jgi:hypothetical protein